ncbi:hypothetical protein DSL72_003775 [Monilinia vaccinii-corymbosi]|uniref:AMP-activated protein kinase glycogen-binding domain-containing protein n=1 Tax=Monilinia vaccinii-corymbosi TaxID=61207 RepID=A0A8A3NUX4_9HELO|nr:hypothetical protein DSL72_003775 [Monilinia vaccinii-corymbosi]
MADTNTRTKTSVVIKYSRPGAAPPIYLAGSFPQSVWQPQEMEYTNESNEQYVFSKSVEVEEGKEYQYKFRIGDGDWWMSDEDAPTVTDEIGNRNNLLTVPIKSTPQVKSVSTEKSPEENSIPRTIPDFDTKEVTMEEPTEPAQHTEPGDKVSEVSHPETSIFATEPTSSTSNHEAEVKPEKTQEIHDASTPKSQADHTVEPEGETPAKELDLSQVPGEELEVSRGGIDEPEHLKSHAQPETAEESKTTTTTTDVSDSKQALTTQEAGEISKEPVEKTDAVKSEEVTTQDALEVLHAETGEKFEDEIVEQKQEPVPIISEKLDLEKEAFVIEGGAKQETAMEKDEDVQEQQEPASTAHENLDLDNDSPVCEGEAKEETTPEKDEVLGHQEDSAPIAIEEPKSNQELQIGESETEEDSVPTHIEEPESVQEPLAGEDEAEEKTGLTDSHAPVDDMQAEELQTSKSQNSEISSVPALIDESTLAVAEELEEDVPQSSENSPSNPMLPNESIESVVEEPSSVEQVVIKETDATPEQEHTISEPIQVEEPIETPTSANENATQGNDSSELIDADNASTIETPADETIEVPEPTHEINSTSQESPEQEVNPEQNKSDEPIESTTNTKSSDEQPRISSEIVSAPFVTVEKVDAEPRHGDDFGSGATFAQRDAHTLHAHDALPDQITIRQQAATPELANIAAEVADSAELLDKAPPTPPMSDKEAGEIGYRRLSHTPVPEVAETAAEVADIAAQIDESFKPTVLELPTPHRDFGPRGLDVLGRDLDIETPSEERAPLFAHECGSPLTAGERQEYERAQSRSAIQEPMFREFDPNDPSLEPFPSDFNQILVHVRRLENQLSEDQTDVEGTPISPVATNGNHHAEGADLTTPSLQPLAHESSPLLPIVEENSEAEPESAFTALPPSMENSQNDGNLPDELKRDFDEQTTGTSDTEISEKASRDSSSRLPAIRTSRSSSPHPPAMKFAQSSRKLHPVLPALPHTPFVENKSLNLEGEAQVSPPTEQGRSSPTITVQPATPAASLNAKVDDSVPEENAAKSTSFAEENSDSQLRARKPTSNVPDRSITPSSMRSAGNDAKSRNFLRAFFQVVFVDWIGGLIRKLCGGGRHTPLAIPALLIAVAAPILYLSGLTNFGFGLGS